ncbi:hypothetical protein [Mucilaginibacter myungsuensis]|uniref:Uncharacterized protein n=1 Tax=Mucilaginibacter myungsuensis TaxID=649104 RepID=A0A929KTZ0_9SPHI|nr:hypothetical protein [Mucilaginibacter myungsuensis]MBE9661509.1 hypothetical protein [Mucilaginibacter myungsuensis]MDN3597652.1 hypothetical protein [Mucilaginibacter myungsuensis]
MSWIQIGNYVTAVLSLDRKNQRSRQCQCFFAQAFTLQAVKAQARTRPTHLTTSPEAVPLSEKEKIDTQHVPCNDVLDNKNQNSPAA